MSFKLETTNREKEVSEVLSQLEKEGMKGYDISGDELAKSHARYMVGGRVEVLDERVFRFGTLQLPCGPVSRGRELTVIHTEFPERPGALRRFLEGIQSQWNISLFHYRNHGAGAPQSPSTFRRVRLLTFYAQPWERYLMEYRYHRTAPTSLKSSFRI